MTDNPLRALVDAGRKMRQTPIVDDDFPEIRDAFDEALNRAEAALAAPASEAVAHGWLHEIEWTDGWGGSPKYVHGPTKPKPFLEQVEHPEITARIFVSERFTPLYTSPPGNAALVALADDIPAMIANLQSARDRMMPVVAARYGDAFDGDFDTMLEAINRLRRIRALAGQAQAKVIGWDLAKPGDDMTVYLCPRCATSMEVDPTAKPVTHPQAQEAGRDSVVACARCGDSGQEFGCNGDGPYPCRYCCTTKPDQQESSDG